MPALLSKTVLPQPKPVGLVLVVSVPSSSTSGGGSSASPLQKSSVARRWSKVRLPDGDSESSSVSSEVSSPKGIGKGDAGGTHADEEINQALKKMSLEADKQLDDDIASTEAPSDNVLSAIVVCVRCQAEDKWKRMLKEWDEDDDEMYWLCARCVQVRKNLPSLNHARHFILKADESGQVATASPLSSPVELHDRDARDTINLTVLSSLQVSPSAAVATAAGFTFH